MAVFVLFCVVSLYFLPSIMNLLHIPLSIIGQTKLRISGPGDILDIIPKVVFASASLLSAPYLIFEMYLFAAPGLQPIERKLGILLQFIFILFSMVTLTIAFYLILPVSLTYGAALTEQYGINDWELSRYLSFSMNILLLSALIVYYPFVIFLYVAKFHKPKISYRIIILISFLLAATITPGTMILIDAGLTVLLSLIYIPTYLTIMILYRAPRNPQTAGQRA
jgi:sec-independent protein translocase protein TatC